MSKVETAFNLKDFLLNELAKLPHDRALQIKGHNAVIRCPFHSGGMERTPSMGILLEPRKGASPGVYSCFACKAKGSWSNFAELYNLTPLSKGKYKEAELSGGLLHLYQEDISPPDYRMMIGWPSSVPWRGIPGKTLAMMECKSVFIGGETWMYLPVLQGEKQAGGIYCKVTRKDKKDKAYINTPGQWSHSTLLGFNDAASRAHRDDPLWVVEGPRDCLRLITAGQRAVALIGAAVTPKKISLIRRLDPPRIIVATDADEAGNTSAEALRSALGKEFDTVRLNMKEGTDPFDLTDEQIVKIRRKLK